MLIAVDPSLLDDIKEVLQNTRLTLDRSLERELQLTQIADRTRLLNEQEACAYLRRDADTLLYYRKHGLTYYKKGKDVWYRKGEIDDWLASGKVNRHNQ